jgi:hypothetical protein
MQAVMRAALIAVIGAGVGCDGNTDVITAPSSGNASVVISYRAATTPRTDLPPGTQACVAGVGATHIHPSWRGFGAFPLVAVAAGRWEFSVSDVPAGPRLSLRISDGNVCDENPTGAATRNVYANDVLLTEIVTTPGSGPEPGFAFSVDTTGRVTP